MKKRRYHLVRNAPSVANELCQQRVGEISDWEVLEELLDILDQKGEEAEFYRVEPDGSVMEIDQENVRFCVSGMDHKLEIRGRAGK